MQPFITPILLFFSSIAISWFVTPILVKFAPKLGLLDQLNGDESWRKVHNQATAKVGGIAIFLGFLISWVIFAPKLSNSSFIWLSFIMLILGLIDDLRGLSAKLRLFIQFACSLYIVWEYQLYIEQIYFLPSLAIAIPNWLQLIFGTFVIVGGINAFNMIDGLDGLACGVGLISLSFLSIAAFLASNDYGVFYLILPIAGALLGFFNYNSYPAKAFIGDSGSYWAGYFLGFFILLLLCGKTLHFSGDFLSLEEFSQPIILFMAIFCCALPVLDTFFVISYRLIQRKHIMEGDKKHFHHSLISLGMNQKQSVGTIYIISIVLGFIGVLPLAQPQYQLDWFLPVICFVMFGVFLLAAMIKNSKLKEIFLYLRLKRNQANEYSKLIKHIQSLIVSIIYVILLAIPMLLLKIDEQLASLGLALFGLLMLTKIMNLGQSRFIPSLILLLAFSYLLIVNNINPVKLQLGDDLYNVQYYYNSLFYFLFFLSLALLALTINRDYIAISPSFILIFLIPLALLLLPDYINDKYRLNIVSLKCGILFFSAYTLIQSKQAYFGKLRFASLVALVYLVFLGLVRIRGIA